MKNAALKKQTDMAGCPRTAAKMKAESTMKMKSPMEMKKSPMEKELVGKQGNLPPELKAKIEAAPAKMRNRKGAMDTESPMKLDKKEIDRRDRENPKPGRGRGLNKPLDPKIPKKATGKADKRISDKLDKDKLTKNFGGDKRPGKATGKAADKKGPMTMKGETTRVVDGGSKMAKRAKADYEKDQAKKKAKAGKKKAFDKVSSDAKANHARQAKAEGLTMAEYKKKLKKRMRGF